MLRPWMPSSTPCEWDREFESGLLQQRVHKLSVPVRAERRIAFTRAYRMQPLAQLPAVCATGLAAAAGWSSVLSILSALAPLRAADASKAN
jgi:hypothetical protein